MLDDNAREVPAASNLLLVLAFVGRTSKSAWVLGVSVVLVWRFAVVLRLSLWLLSRPDWCFMLAPDYSFWDVTPWKMIWLCWKFQTAWKFSWNNSTHGHFWKFYKNNCLEKQRYFCKEGRPLEEFLRPPDAHGRTNNTSRANWLTQTELDTLKLNPLDPKS